MNTEHVREEPDENGCICPQDFTRSDCPACRDRVIALDTHRPLTDLGDALVFLAEIEFVMRHAPIKQHDRTPEEQKAVEQYTTYWVWIKDVLRQAAGRDARPMGRRRGR